MRLTLIGHSTVLVECGAARLLVDPYFGLRGNLAYRRVTPPSCKRNDVGEVDAVLISHAHFDHVDRRYLSSLRDATPVYGPRRAARWIALKGGHAVTGLDPWQEIEVRGVRVAAVPAHHLAPTVGYVVIADGRALYFAGDTYRGDFMAEIERRYRPEICLMPVSTFKIPMTMGNRGALGAARLLRPRAIVPIHLGIEPRSPLLRRREGVDSFRSLVRAEQLTVDVVSLAPGEQLAW